MNLYHVTKFSLNLSYTVLYFSKKTVVSRYFHPLEFFLDHCISLFSVLRISQLEAHVYRKRDSKSFYYQDRIRHFRNEKGTGAEMHPSIYCFWDCYWRHADQLLTTEFLSLFPVAVPEVINATLF